ncbi:hypothetical protein ES702_07554 [subsurface metagenome]
MDKIEEFKAKIEEYEDDLFGATIFYEETKLMWPRSRLREVNFEEHYKSIMHRGKVIIGKAEKVLSEVITNGDVDKFKEIQFPPLMPVWYPDSIPRFKLLVETYNELFPGRDRTIALTKQEHKLIMNRVLDKF